MTNGLFTPREKPIFIEMNEKQIARTIDGADQQPYSLSSAGLGKVMLHCLIIYNLQVSYNKSLYFVFLLLQYSMLSVQSTDSS